MNSGAKEMKIIINSPQMADGDSNLKYNMDIEEKEYLPYYNPLELNIEWWTDQYEKARRNETTLARMEIRQSMSDDNGALRLKMQVSVNEIARCNIRSQFNVRGAEVIKQIGKTDQHTDYKAMKEFFYQSNPTMIPMEFFEMDEYIKAHFDDDPIRYWGLIHFCKELYAPKHVPISLVKRVIHELNDGELQHCQKDIVEYFRELQNQIPDDLVSLAKDIVHHCEKNIKTPVIKRGQEPDDEMATVTTQHAFSEQQAIKMLSALKRKMDAIERMDLMTNEEFAAHVSHSNIPSNSTEIKPSLAPTQSHGGGQHTPYKHGRISDIESSHAKHLSGQSSQIQPGFHMQMPSRPTDGISTGCSSSESSEMDIPTFGVSPTHSNILNSQMSPNQEPAQTPKMEMQPEDDDDEDIDIEALPNMADHSERPAFSIRTTHLGHPSMNVTPNPGVEDIMKAIPMVPDASDGAAAARGQFQKAHVNGDSMLNIDEFGMVFMDCYDMDDEDDEDDDNDEEIDLNQWVEAIPTDSTAVSVHAMMANTASRQTSMTMSSMQSSNSALPGGGKLRGGDETEILCFD